MRVSASKIRYIDDTDIGLMNSAKNNVYKQNNLSIYYLASTPEWRKGRLVAEVDRNNINWSPTAIMLNNVHSTAPDSCKTGIYWSAEDTRCRPYYLSTDKIVIQESGGLQAMVWLTVLQLDAENGYDIHVHVHIRCLIRTKHMTGYEKIQNMVQYTLLLIEE